MTSRSQEHSSRYYERQAEATRHRLAHELDELGNRLTPGQVFDEMLTYAKGGGGTFLRALSNATRDNPVPSLLIGAGCMMFLSEKMGLNRYIARKSDGDGRFAGSVAYDTGDTSSHGEGMLGRAAGAAASGARSAADSVRSGVRSATDFTSEQASNVTEGVKKGAAAVGDTISSTTQRVRGTAQNLRDQARETGEQIKRGAQNLTDSVQEYSASIGEQVTDTADRTRQQTMRAAQQTKDTLVSFVNEQPLLCAAIGLAVGAAIAAALPSTETEDELMGEASDAVKEAVSETASDQFATAKAAATRVAQEAKSVAEREGLTPAAAVDAAKNLGEKVKTVVSEAGTAGKSEVREFASTNNKT